MTVMICHGDWFADEEPQHTVFLDAFYIELTETTNAMYQRYVELGACTEPSENRSFSRDSYYGNPAYVGYPVIYVSWDQAANYCR
jgi:formylglycine-generating enzyme required for sulfatase activity